ncbi:MAG: protocatechuate 3,4-dioxygenase subunit beta [Bryobacterales bacterium]|nr:protocatechuate 3,4-dioxygenase subunit beta [Bryobacterales bacterium]
MKLVVSPCNTTGPFFPREFSDGNEDLTRRDGARARGEHIILAGRVLELGAKPTWNMVLEVWQADTNGIFRHPLDPRFAEVDPGFWGWGRARTDPDGWYRFRTVLPGGDQRIPHINCAVLGIGLTRRLVTTIFFTDAPDPVFDCVPGPELRQRLIARRDPSLNADGAAGYRFDVILRGEGETPFFVD